MAAVGFICGPCIHRKYDGAPGIKLTEIGPREKQVCTECGKRAYGARCRVEVLKKAKPSKN